MPPTLYSGTGFALEERGLISMKENKNALKIQVGIVYNLGNVFGDRLDF